MSGGVQVTGLDELRRQLTGLPAELREEGGQIVKDETEAAAREIQQYYPEASHTVHGTGTLRARLRTVYPVSAALIGMIVSAAPHAHLWHWGTKTRQNAKGANRGAMPAARPEPLVPIVTRRRDNMFRRLKAMLERRGFQVQA